MRLKFYGHSDDCFEFEIDGKADEWGCYQSKDDQVVHLTARVATIGGARGVIIYALYDGTWSFAVAQRDEGLRLPEWSYSVVREHVYSTALLIDTGGDLVEVVKVKRGKNDKWVKAEDEE